MFYNIFYLEHTDVSYLYFIVRVQIESGNIEISVTVYDCRFVIYIL